MLTFVVYYRIHLNLNLEASARQWPNNPISSRWGWGGESHPETVHTYGISVILGSQAFSEYEQTFPKSWNTRLYRLCSISNESDRLWRLIECSWAFLSKKRLTHSGANGFFEKAKNQTVCPYLWEILDTVTVNTKFTKWLSLTTLFKVFMARYIKDQFMFTNLDWTLQGDGNGTSSPVLLCFWGELPLQSKPLPSHAMLIAKYIHIIAIYMYIDEYIYLQFTLIWTE